ncbi:MAG: precorrin-8X methylmutase [Nitrospirae bacterium]|nr:precorrin-8X methylmutase [Nitrospirota bacterium]
MEIILIAGHGSPRKEANNLEHVASLLHNTIHPGCSNACVRTAYLQFAKPDIMEAINGCVKDGAKKIIIHPYFLSSGMHVTTDIPAIVKEAAGTFPNVEFVYTEPLGVHNNMAQVVLERIHSASGLKPDEIEKRSFEIISEEMDLSDVPSDRLPIIKRVIHSTADFEFKNSLMFHPGAVTAGLSAIKAGKDILTDIEMVRAGINKRLLSKWGGKVICNIQQSAVVGASGRSPVQKTKAEIGIESALRENNNIGIVAIGNAPTALLKVIEIFSLPLGGSGLKPDPSLPLVVGVPVGFVKALEAKALLAQQSFPFITNLSRKGGTPVAVAIVNALLKMAGEEGR